MAAAASSQWVSWSRQGWPRSSWRDMTAFAVLLLAAEGLTSQRAFQLKTPTSFKLGATERPVRQRASKAWSASASLKERDLGAGRLWRC
eukprot:10428963-Alexandrium_andersonii.AAC.1